jgi:DNA polymerase-3 subunit epsilon
MIYRCDPNQPLAEAAFAVFDVETTGLSPAYGDRVCEVAVVRLSGDLEVERFVSLVDPGRPLSIGAAAVNGITAEMLVGAPRFAAIAGQLLSILDGAVLVAHNAPFDLGFLAMELDIARMPPPEGEVVDTLNLARRVFRFPRNGLQAVAHALRIEPGMAHRALGDACTTAEVLARILREVEARWGVRTLGQLLEFQGGSIPYPYPQALPLPPPIAEALECSGQVRMRYVDAHGQETVRLVRPLRVHERRGLLYLVAHCYKAGELRTFRLDRVVELALEGEP